MPPKDIFNIYDVGEYIDKRISDLENLIANEEDEKLQIWSLIRAEELSRIKRKFGI